MSDTTLLPLFSNADSSAADRLTADGGVPTLRLMENAGRLVAEAAQGLLPPSGSVLIACGPGNNGGDGYVAARVLAGRGYRVTLAALGTPRAGSDAGLMAPLWDGPILRLDETDLEGFDLVIDALFGAGLGRDLDGEARAFIERLAGSEVPVLAVDVPSGVDGDSGQVRGAAAPATLTVTFHAPKPGHYLEPGASLCGELLVGPIGIPDDAADTIGVKTFLNGPETALAALHLPETTGHKYARGHALILSGGVEGAGAARLGARAALRVGAGLVTIAAPEEALLAHSAALDAVMVRRAEHWAALLADPRKNAVLLGPGGGIGAPMRTAIGAALGPQRDVVLDADALTSFAGEASALKAMIADAQAQGRVVITPHEGEFQHLFSAEEAIARVESKLERARRAAAFLDAVVLLKGADTVVASPDGRAVINAHASPWLATAGSGDVLAGLIAGLLAQGADPFEAACGAAWLHGEAGIRLGPGLISEDIPAVLPALLNALLT
jgi:NAD(P)H-hydrate epimerase